MAKIWSVTKDPGGHNAVWPVSEELRRRGQDVLDIAHGKTIQILTQRKVSFLAAQDESIVEWIIDSPPDAYITSICSGGGVGRNLIPVMRDMGIPTPTIAVSGFWAALQPEFADSAYWPNVTCVQDELAKEMVLKVWRGYREENVVITGQPAFDNLAYLNMPHTLSEVREKAGCKKNWPIVLYAGQLEKSGKTLKALVRALNKLPQKVYLAPLNHPRLLDDAPEEAELHKEAVEMFNNGAILEKGDFSTDEWVAASDVVTSMFSTVLATGAYLRKECISMLLTRVGAEKFHKDLGFSFLPMEELGSCSVARNMNDLDALLKRALSKNGLGNRTNQKKHFPMDENSARRVADVVCKLL